MADLDDFFARKDKKKKGKGKKYAVTSGSSMAKSLEQQGVQPAPENETKAEKISLPNIPAQDDEWREEEEQKEDLEGLKVQALKLEEQDEPTERYQSEKQGDTDDDEDATEKSGVASPWQNVTAQPTDVIEQPPPNTEKPTGAYVPPSLRRMQQAPTRRPHQPPDIQSDRAFPTLQSSLQIDKKEDRNKSKDFTEVKGGKSARSADSHYQAPGLELRNKYTALETN